MSPLPPSRRPSLARRALPALVLTGASITFLHALDRPAATADAASGDGGVVPSATPVGGGTPITVTLPPSLTPTSTVAPAVDPAAPTTVAAPVDPAAPATTVAPETTPAPAAAVVCTTYDGPGVWTKWGTVQVEASVTPDGTICAVDAIQTPNDRRRSIAINERAVPILDASALAAQGTNFDGVSGATVTSNGYKQSLQALLDGLG